VRRGWIGLIVAAGLLAACDPSSDATVEAGVEHVPGPGYLHIEADPVVLDRAITVRFFGSDHQPSGVVIRVPAGQRIVIDHTSLPGEEGLIVDAQSCGGTVPVVLERETDVRLELGAGGCKVFALETHVLGLREHEPGLSP